MSLRFIPASFEVLLNRVNRDYKELSELMTQLVSRNTMSNDIYVKLLSVLESVNGWLPSDRFQKLSVTQDLSVMVSRLIEFRVWFSDYLTEYITPMIRFLIREPYKNLQVKNINSLLTEKAFSGELVDMSTSLQIRKYYSEMFGGRYGTNNEVMVNSSDSKMSNANIWGNLIHQTDLQLSRVELVTDMEVLKFWQRMRPDAKIDYDDMYLVAQDFDSFYDHPLTVVRGGSVANQTTFAAIALTPVDFASYSSPHFPYGTAYTDAQCDFSTTSGGLRLMGALSVAAGHCGVQNLFRLKNNINGIVTFSMNLESHGLVGATGQNNNVDASIPLTVDFFLSNGDANNVWANNDKVSTATFVKDTNLTVSLAMHASDTISIRVTKATSSTAANYAGSFSFVLTDFSFLPPKPTVPLVNDSGVITFVTSPRITDSLGRLGSKTISAYASRYDELMSLLRKYDSVLEPTERLAERFREKLEPDNAVNKGQSNNGLYPSCYFSLRWWLSRGDKYWLVDGTAILMSRDDIQKWYAISVHYWLAYMKVLSSDHSFREELINGTI
jgi:hypothetical protein